MEQLKILMLCIWFSIFTQSVLSQYSVSFPVKLDESGFLEVIAQADELYISGQPDEDAFVKLKSEGVTTVVNLRTQKEMDNREYVPFDEAALLDSLGMEYIHIPLGGTDNPYTNEALTKFAEAVDKSEGKLLLHCTVARRASHMFAAYLIQYKGFEPNKAIEYAKAVNFGEWPLEGLLGQKLKVEFE
jgi:uncharacterized protein (TIGR01244 family)